MNINEIKVNHRFYIGKPFSCPAYGWNDDRYRLTERERSIIEKYGAWMEALTNKLISPFTPEQHHFIEVDSGKIIAVTDFEKAWVKVKTIKNKIEMRKNKNNYDCYNNNFYYTEPKRVTAYIDDSLIVYSNINGQD